MICADANTAVKWVLPEEHSEKALSLFADAVQTGQTIIVPPLLPIEVTNTVRRQILTRGVPIEEARRMLEQFFTFDVTVLNPPNLHVTAFDIAVEYGLPAAYDAHYLSLAQIIGCSFWTADQRLINSLRGRLHFVRWIGDYTGPQDLE